MASFAKEIRVELTKIPVKHNCCRRALAEGLLTGAEYDDAARCVRVRYAQEETAALAAETFLHQYGKEPEAESVGKCGHRFHTLSLTAPTSKRLIRAMDEASSIDEILTTSCEGCSGAYLRGLFLACGTVNDPHKSFHMEYKVLPRRADLVSTFFESVGYQPRRVTRDGYVGLYFKDGPTVEDLLTIMGAAQGYFEVVNTRIERDIRNNENRATNCVARNIEKTIAAATKQMEAINRLVETGKLASLPIVLQETARIRYANPDASLDELVTLHSPMISKSGLNHRLQKIVDAADEL